MFLLKKVKNIFRPGVLKNKKLVSYHEPRYSSEAGFEPFMVECRESREMERHLLEHSDTLFRSFSPQNKIMVKINLNTADGYPASTNTETLKALVAAMKKLGLHDLTIADCSSNKALPTRKVAKSLGFFSDELKDVKFLFFDERKWVGVSIQGEYLKQVALPEEIFTFDRVIHLANMKSHRLADFSFCMKLSVGYLHPLERYGIHKENLREKVAEINLAFEADLSIIDAIKVFVSGGPSIGRVEDGNKVIFGSSPLKTDIFAYGYFSELKSKYGCTEDFETDWRKSVQILHALKVGLRST